MHNSPLSRAIHEAMTEMPHQDASGTITSSFCCDKTFIGFDGHFTDNPILPAIAQLLIGAVATGVQQARIVSISRAKFTRIIVPGERIDAACTLSEHEKDIVASVRLSVDGDPAASFQLVVTNEIPHG